MTTAAIKIPRQPRCAVLPHWFNSNGNSAAVRTGMDCRYRYKLQRREQNRRPPGHNLCLMSIRLGVTRFQAGSSRGLKAAVSAEDAVRNMDNNGGTRARTFT